MSASSNRRGDLAGGARDDDAGVPEHASIRAAASRTVTDQVVGSGIRFEALGGDELKGAPGTGTLYAEAEEEPSRT
jgi:hypothetical protein